MLILRKDFSHQEKRSLTVKIHHKGPVRCLSCSNQIFNYVVRQVHNIFSLVFAFKSKRKRVKERDRADISARLIFFQSFYLSSVSFQSWKNLLNATLLLPYAWEQLSLSQASEEGGVPLLIRQQKKTKAPLRPNVHTNNYKGKKLAKAHMNSFKRRCYTQGVHF